MPFVNPEAMLSALYENDEDESVRQWAAAVASHDPTEAEKVRRTSSVTIKAKPRSGASSIYTLRRGSSSQFVRSRLTSVAGRKMP